MPLEGHYRRVNTPLRKLTPRERNVLIVGTSVTVIAILALIFIPGASDSRPAPAPGCFETVVAGRVGGEPVSACGAEARAACARASHFDDPRGRKIVETCREAGIPIVPSAASAASG